MHVATLELPWAAFHDAESATEQAARQGDRSAWSELVARHDRQVLLALLARGVLPAQARELAQDAWLRLITQADARKLDRLQLPGLVIRQALFLAQSAARRERPLPQSGEAEVTPSAEQRYVDLERLARAQSVLATQHPSAQRIFSLLYAQPQLSHAEVATQVGLSIQRVRQILCEVRKVLRAELEGEVP